MQNGARNLEENMPKSNTYWFIIIQSFMTLAVVCISWNLRKCWGCYQFLSFLCILLSLVTYCSISPKV